MRRAVILVVFLVLVVQPGATLAVAQETGLERISPGGGDLQAAIPADTGCFRILFDETHGWATDIIVGEYTIAHGFSELADFLRGNGHIVESLQDPAPFVFPTIKRYDILVLALPGEFYTPDEKAIIAQFVNQGGRLVTIGENGNYPGNFRDILNDVHDYLVDGLGHNKDILEDPTDNKDGVHRRPLIHTFSSNPINSGVSTILEIYGSSLQIAGPANGTAFGDNDTSAVSGTLSGAPAEWSKYGSLFAGEPMQLVGTQINGPLVVQALSPVGAGDVFAIGDANLWDNTDLDGNGIVNLYEYDNAQLAKNVFAFGKKCEQCWWALFKDNDPWAPQTLQRLSIPYPTAESDDESLLDSTGNFSQGDLNTIAQLYSREDVDNLLAAPALGEVSPEWIDPNERVMQAWNIPYTIFHSTDIAGVDLEPYCKAIVASQQPLTFYQSLSENRTWFESWINGGGMLEFHGAPYLSDDWSGLPMPGGFSMSYYNSNNVSINDAAHLLSSRPNPISSAELENWGFSSHGYLVDLPADSLEIITHESAGMPMAAKFSLGDGCVVATELTIEWGWDLEYSPILENYILHDDCESNYHLYLSLTMRGAP